MRKNVSNFKMKDIAGSSALNVKAYAEVDVETLRLFRKNDVEVLGISKPYGGYWTYDDTGKFCGEAVDNAQRVYEAKNKRDIWSFKRNE